MPIYEYECEICGDRLEAIQKISDAPLLECPTCGEPRLKKLVSAAGFRLSGSGWYETDFKNKGKRNIAEQDSRQPEKSKEKKEKPQIKSTDTKTKQAASGS